jgi:hypothetical protein
MVRVMVVYNCNCIGNVIIVLMSINDGDSSSDMMSVLGNVVVLRGDVIGDNDEWS